MADTLGFLASPPSNHTATAWAWRRLGALVAPAGLVLNGRHLWDPQLHSASAAWRILLGGTLGAGEAYVDGDWDCAALDVLTARLLAAEADRPLAWRASAIAQALAARVVNGQTKRRARRAITSHYDLDDALYEAMLGPTMAYSCGYWRAATTLDEAQRAKWALVCRKLALTPGQRLLDVGCGWGGFAEYAARHHDVKIVGITVSPSQAAAARARCAGLPIDIVECDYRDVRGRFDRIVSIGMFEHVGPRNYRAYFDTMRRLLTEDGLMLLHTIGGLVSRRTTDAWIDRHVFPGSVLPSAAQIARALEGRFVIEDWHNFGADYDRTLMAWHARFEVAWPALAHRYPERFRRLWRYYLLTCAGTFRARRNQLWQLVLSPHGVAGGHRRLA
ncbi:MAG: cyclopropane fatty acyl phospholipid synthase [Acidobacteria bacterium]|nr:cyclopropane fatty acyl phospholipid synthase [Acidobacteriota bacterium]